MKKNLLLLISAIGFSITSNAQTDITLDIQSFIGPINETIVNFTTSNSDLKVTFTGLNYDAVLFNGQNLIQNGSVFPVTGGYFTIPFANGDNDTLYFEWGGDTHTLYLNPFDLNAGEVTTIDFTVYPNPTTDFLHINIENYSGSFDVYDMAGKLLIQTKEKTIDVRSLSPGSYILHAGERVQKVIVE